MTSTELYCNRPIAEIFGRHAGYAFAGDGVQTAVGNYTRTAVDLPMPSGLTWVRTYNSLDERVGILGRGWTPTHTAHLVVESPDTVVFHDEDGRALIFVREESGVYRRPQDIDADLIRADNGYFTLRFFSGETWHFDAAGRLLTRTVEGQSAALEYDPGGRLVAVAHAAGHRLDLDYDTRGFLVRIVADDGRAVTYDYGPDSTLSMVTHLDGTVTRYDSTASGQLERVVNPDGVILVTNTYDDAGRVRHQGLAGAGEVDFSYDETTGRTVVTTNPGGNRTTFEHDQSARVTGVTDPLGNTATLSYDADGRFVEAMTPGGTRIAHSYDSSGDLIAGTWGDATTTYTYDWRHRLTSHTDPTGATTHYTYDGTSRLPTTITDHSGAVTRYTVRDGLITSMVDPDGGTVTYTYDHRRNLVATTDATGQTTRYAHDTAGRRTAVTTPVGETTRYDYDGAGRVVAVTEPSGATTRRRYSASGLLLETIDPDGAASTNTYDAAGQLTVTTDALGVTTTYAYDAAGNLASITGPNGTEANVTSDELGRMTTVSDSTGAIWRYTYDADGNQTTEEGPDETTRTTWDERGNPVAITDATGATMHYAYDLSNRITAITDSMGATWHTAYDDARRTVIHTDPTGATTTEEQTAGGRRAAVIDPLGRRKEYCYDAAGRVVEIIDPEGGVTRFAYDGAGRRSSHTTPAGLVTRFEYESGRLSATVDLRGWITRYRYNVRGERTEVIAPSGATTRYQYDVMGQLVAVTDSRGGTAYYDYDAVGNLTALTDAKGAITRYTHSAAGQRTSKTDPLGRTTRREYDEAGNLISVTEPSGQAMHMRYDGAGRLVRRTGHDGTEVRYTYDRAGRRTSMTDATGTTHYTYDAAGRLLTVTEPDGGVLTARYDAAGQRVALRYPDGAEVRYRYDRNGRLVRLRDSEAGEAVYAIDPDGRLITEQLPGGWARRYDYEGGLLSRFLEIRAGCPVTRTHLTRDADGRIVGQDDGNETWCFGYDPGGQLVSAVRRSANAPTGNETHLAYDIVGNRTAITRNGVATRYLYDAADQLVAIETAGRRIGYRYDAAGRLVEEFDGDLRHTVAYDGLDLPREIVRTRAWAVERARATFNGDGLLTDLALRTGDDHAPETTLHYRWSVGDTVPQILTQRVHTRVPQATDTAPVGRDLATARFTYGYGRVFATAAHGSVNFARDAFGSTIRTEQTLPWAQASSYDVFGAPPAEAEPNRPPLLAPELPRFGYRGELAFGSLLYLRARTYDAGLGRFATRDPLSFLGEGSLANNPYSYATNDPLNRVDPLGTWALVDGAAGILAGIVAGESAGSGCYDSGLHKDCSNPGNSIKRHDKCFQLKGCLRTRGYLPERALDADTLALRYLWHIRRPEDAAQSFTIHELNFRRQNIGERVWDETWWGATAIDPEVDWEVGLQRPVVEEGWRIDIVTSQRDIFEQKLRRRGKPPKERHRLSLGR